MVNYVQSARRDSRFGFAADNAPYDSVRFISFTRSVCFVSDVDTRRNIAKSVGRNQYFRLLGVMNVLQEDYFTIGTTSVHFMSSELVGLTGGGFYFVLFNGCS